MPVEMSIFTLPGGARCLRMVTSGHFSREDADAVVKEMNLGGSMNGLPQLVLTQQQASISSDARGLFATRGDKAGEEPWVAVVVSSPVIREVANFLVRINQNKRATLFSGEKEAIRWLDERTRAEAAKAKAI